PGSWKGIWRTLQNLPGDRCKAMSWSWDPKFLAFSTHPSRPADQELRLKVSSVRDGHGSYEDHRSVLHPRRSLRFSNDWHELCSLGHRLYLSSDSFSVLPGTW